MAPKGPRRAPRRLLRGSKRPPRDRGVLEISILHSRQTLLSFCFLFGPSGLEKALGARRALRARTKKQRRAGFAGHGEDVSESRGIPAIPSSSRCRATQRRAPCPAPGRFLYRIFVCLRGLIRCSRSLRHSACQPVRLGLEVHLGPVSRWPKQNSRLAS